MGKKLRRALGGGSKKVETPAPVVAATADVGEVKAAGGDDPFASGVLSEADDKKRRKSAVSSLVGGTGSTTLG